MGINSKSKTTMTREQSRRKNFLDRCEIIQQLHGEKREEFYTEWEWYPTRKSIWKRFVYPAYKISYRTFNRQLNTDVKSEMEQLNNQIKNRIGMKIKIQPQLFILIALMAFQTSCAIFSPTGEVKGSRQALAAYCAEQFPCKDSLAVDTLYLDSTIWEIPDFDTVFIDTVVCPPSDSLLTLTDTVEVTVPGRRIFIPVMRIDSTWWRQDSALVTSLRLKNKQLKAANTELREMALFSPDNKKDLPWWWLVLVGIGGYIVRKLEPKSKKNSQSI